MEEAHLANHHIGGEKLYHVLQGEYYWPGMKKDCSEFVGRCFECQLSSGKSHGSWQGKLVPLPPGPRCEWSIDLIVNLGPEGQKRHILSAIDTFSKFCVLTVVPDKKSVTMAKFI